MWAQLASEVDTILHNGALVNHAFTYEQLFEPNVLGSVEVSGRLSDVLQCTAIMFQVMSELVLHVCLVKRGHLLLSLCN